MRLLAVSLCFLLAGCEAVAPCTVASVKLSKSQEAYRQCVQANPSNADQQCKAQHEIYETDLQTLRAQRQC